MRTITIALLVLGVVLLGGGLFFGCGFYAEWNGRNVVLETPLTPGTPVSAEVDAMPSRRYTFSARVTVDGRDLPEETASKGASALELSMPFAMQLRNGDGQTVQEQSGFLSNQPPTSVYGDPTGGASGRGSRAIVAERFLGPYPSAGPQKLHVELDLGADQLGKARLADARLVVYDDAMPPRVRRAFGAAGVGAVAFFAGLVGALVLLARKYLRTR